MVVHRFCSLALACRPCSHPGCVASPLLPPLRVRPGALATLFGFYAAAAAPLPLPVTVVSVASPRVGNLAFARAFVVAESRGRLRHLRVANDKDPVTLGPTVSSRRALALSAKAVSPLGYLALVLTGNHEGGDEEVYHHTGVRLKLLKAQAGADCRRSTLSYSGAALIAGAPEPAAQREDGAAAAVTALPAVAYHYGTSYAERMAAVEAELEGTTLNDLYREMASAACMRLQSL